MKKIIILIFSVIVAGCANQPLEVSLSPVDYPRYVNQEPTPKLEAVTILNKAPEGVLVNTLLGSDTINPIKAVTKTSETVEEDISSYFKERTSIVSDAHQSLRVVIHKADSYWVWGGAAKIPIFGLAAVNADTEFGLNLKITFEVEEGGKVVRTYMYDDVITIQAKATTRETIKESYKKLIDKYRAVLFSELDSDFVNRYM